MLGSNSPLSLSSYKLKSNYFYSLLAGGLHLAEGREQEIVEALLLCAPELWALLLAQGGQARRQGPALPLHLRRQSGLLRRRLEEKV